MTFIIADINCLVIKIYEIFTWENVFNVFILRIYVEENKINKSALFITNSVDLPDIIAISRKKETLISAITDQGL